MNEVMKAIQERRSIRSYTPDQIAAADRDAIVTAGLYAPSSKNTQAWHIAVVQNAARIEQLTVEVKAAIIRCRVEKYLALANNPAYRVSFGAPTFMIISADPALTTCPAEDCALVLGNMFLAAHSLGIGSCWVNQLGPVCDDPAFRDLLTGLGVPASAKVCGCAAFGYNAGKHPAAPARREGTVTLVGA